MPKGKPAGKVDADLGKKASPECAETSVYIIEPPELSDIKLPAVGMDTRSVEYQMEDLEASLLIVEDFPAVRCPISFKLLTDPLTNKYCGHSYDRETVEIYICSKKKKRCPVIGCTNDRPLTKHDLKDDCHSKEAIILKERKPSSHEDCILIC